MEAILEDYITAFVDNIILLPVIFIVVLALHIAVFKESNKDD